MGVRSSFEQAVREAAQGTPLVVTRTRDGFDVTLDLDGRWAGRLHEAGLREVKTQHVVVVDDDTYTVTDDVRTVEWEAGVARLSASAQRVRGRAVQRGVEQTWAVGRDGLRKTSDVRYGDGQGRALIRAAGKELGLTERRGAAERIGLGVAVVAAVGAVVTLLVLGAQALLGSG